MADSPLHRSTPLSVLTAGAAASRAWPGQPVPLCATCDGEGTKIALFSAIAPAVELCFFDRPEDAVEQRRVPLRERTDQIWHVYLPVVRPGQLYA